jgi:FkbM family methyltransferase
MLARPSLRWPGARQVRAVRLKNVRGALYVRLGTSDFWVLEELFLEHEYHPFFAHDAEPVKTILDLGANVGLSVRLWLGHYPDARIVAVEPDAKNIAMALRNTKGRGGVSLVRACVAGRPRMVALDRSALEWQIKLSDADANAAGADLVEALTVPQLLERFAIDGAIDLLKCDIEGAEAEVFANCSPWIERVRELVVELHAPYTEENLLEDLRKGGVEPHIYGAVDKGGQRTIYAHLVLK